MCKGDAGEAMIHGTPPCATINRCCDYTTGRTNQPGADMISQATPRWAFRARRNMLWLGGALIVLGAALTPLFVDEAMLKLKARNWPEAPARITGARLKGGTGSILFGLPVELRFFISLRGGTYDATQVVPDAVARDLRVTVPPSLIEQRQPNIRVMCAYNPTNPREALVVRDWNRRDARALLPLVLIAFGIGMIAHGRRVGREALDPAGQLRHRNAAGWDVARTPQGFRCVPKPERGLSVAKLTDMVKGQPFTAIELIDYPLRGNGPNRMRIERPPAAERRGIAVHLELIGRFRQTKRAAPILVSSGREPPDHV